MRQSLKSSGNLQSNKTRVLHLVCDTFSCPDTCTYYYYKLDGVNEKSSPPPFPHKQKTED